MMQNYTVMLLSCISAYLIGSIPFGMLIARKQGIDIRTVGSGNIGATNIARNLGWKTGALVGVLDFTKSFVPALVARTLFARTGLVLLVSLMPVLGHLFPIWLQFKGGKGVATIFGILGAYFGLLYFLGFLAIWLFAVKKIRLMSLVNLAAALLFPLAFWLKFEAWIFVLFGLLLCSIIWISHRANIKRLLAGEENLIKL